MVLQPKSIAVAAFNDCIADGNNYFSDLAIYIYKDNDTLADIYSTASGSNKINQDGLGNKTNSIGVFDFFIEGGRYYAVSGSKRLDFWVINAELISFYAETAEAAAAQSSANAKIFDTLANGESSTINGDYFSVVGVDDDTYLDLYINTSGSGVYLKSYPTTELIDEIKEKIDNGVFDSSLINGANSNMSSQNDWVVDVGSPLISFSSGEMLVDMPASTNASVILPVGMDIGECYQLEVKLKLHSGISSLVQIGSAFSASPSSIDRTLTRPDSDYYVISQKIIATSANAYIGVASSDNNGLVIALDYIKITKASVSSLDLIERIDSTSRDLSGNLLDSYSSLMKYPNQWTQDIGSPTINYNTDDGSASIKMISGESTNIRINDLLEIGKTYTVKFTCKSIDGIPSKLKVGKFASSGLGFETVTPTGDYEQYKVTFEAVVDYLSIGSVSSENLGQTIKLKDLFISEYSEESTLEGRVESIENELVTGSILDENSEKMMAPTNWSGQIGNPVLDYITNTGAMTVDLGNGINRSVSIDTPELVIDNYYDVTVRLKVFSGEISRLVLGRFTGTITEQNKLITPTYDYQDYSFSIKSGVTYFAIGVISSENNGTVIAIENVLIKDSSRRLSNIEHDIDLLRDGGTGGSPTKTLGADSFMSSISRYDKPLVKFCVAGDSLMGNYVGGSIPTELDEGEGYRPIRLDVNSVPRRIYDHIAFNKAEHRRLDVVEWNKSGAWDTVNDSSVWEPSHPETLYHKTSNPLSYAEITVPDGSENFAIICQRDLGMGVINITLNGGDISSYGPSSVDLNRIRDSAADRGNPYNTVEYIGLPAGDNVIRITKENNSDEVRVWGGFYWSGVTLIVQNIAHGGHTLGDLINQHLRAEMTENDFDCILFELTMMNELSNSIPASQTVENMNRIISDYAKDKDQLYMTTNPFGDNGSGTNYYTLYPGMKESVDECIKSLKATGTPYINIFDMFKNKIENRGGTLEGGEGGIYYTTDGQHGNVAGCREWFNLLKPYLSNKPYSE